MECFKIPNYDPSHFDHLKKILKTFIRDGNFITELKIGLQVGCKENNTQSKSSDLIKAFDA